MRAATLLLLLGSSLTLGQYPQDKIDSGEALANLSKEAYDNAIGRLGNKTEGCTRQNVRVRKEWRRIPAEERVDFVRAVECLMDKETLHPDVDGARSRFDDFGVLHFKLLNRVHLSALFFLFHRYFIWTYEEALRNECGYEGTFPYWNWGEDDGNVEGSPLLDGSPTSLGSNGAFENTTPLFGVPQGSGGGCILEGPFANRTVNLGPGASTKYNPRCIKRDFNSHIIANWGSFRNTTDVILDSPNIEMFQALLQGDSRYPEAGKLGPATHGSGHFAVGGDPGGDFNWSALEPTFYLHHGQVDRLYFVWQNLQWKERQNIYGTGTMNNRPASPNATLDDILDMSPLSEPRKLGELLDTVGESPFCFVYA